MRLIDPKQSLFWYANDIQTEFPDNKTLAQFKRHPTGNFEFDAANSTDDGELILVNHYVPKACSYNLTSRNSKVELMEGQDGILASVIVEVMLMTKPELTAEELEYWTEELGGFATATITLAGMDAYVTDRSSGFFLGNGEVIAP